MGVSCSKNNKLSLLDIILSLLVKMQLSCHYKKN